jgi:2-polyprenyl-3-methyl-5-hydroxy-6-metoxy-1,4-benzoquinol methylase
VPSAGRSVQPKIYRERADPYTRPGCIPPKRILVEALKKENLAGRTLLDIGGDLGLIQHEFMDAGVIQVTSVDASAAYLSAARKEAQRLGQTEGISYHHCNFVDLADALPQADVVTLDRSCAATMIWIIW